MGLRGSRIVLGVTGGIAAYKSVEIVRQLVKAECEVKVVMTESATKFITPLSFRTITKYPVITDLFARTEEPVPHVSLAKWAELILIVPATADILARAATGRANDLLTAIILDSTAPVLWAPAMNTRMWCNLLTQKNIKTLVELGHNFINPVKGELACGETGEGHLARLEDIINKIHSTLSSKKTFFGHKFLITAGPTREPWDNIRFLSNRSSGKMGYALAEQAVRRGGEVTLISGPVSLPVPDKVKLIKINTALELYKAAMLEFMDAEVVIAAAAVADYRPAQVHNAKLKKPLKILNIALEPNPDILLEMGQKKQKQILVGFAAENENLSETALAKLSAKNLDLIVANYAQGKEDAFGSDQSKIFLINKQKEIEAISKQPKNKLANIILDRLSGIMNITEGK